MRWVLAAVLCLLPVFGAAKEATPSVEDPVLEERLMRLAKELRCLVCQNESLADSHADLAADLRQQIRDQMKAGRSDEQIKAWLTQRYGDFVLYRTPIKATTIALWFGPFALLLAGPAGLLLYLRRRRGRVGRPGLTPEDQARARALLQEAERGGNADPDAAARG
jgi:cytochrome c-type biogenesis protein CcmH